MHRPNDIDRNPRGLYPHLRTTGFRTMLAGLLLAMMATPFSNVQAKSKTQPLLLNWVVAIVNKSPITWRELQQRLREVKAELQSQGTPMPPMHRLEKQVLNQMITNQIQVDMAQSQGVNVDATLVNDAVGQIAQNNELSVSQLRSRLTAEGYNWHYFVQQIKQRLLVAKLQQQVSEQKVHITNSAVKEFLANYANRIDPGQKLHLAQILIAIPSGATPDQIRKIYQKAIHIRQKALHGEPFDKLAIEYSAGQHALKGGNLGWIPSIDLPRFILRATNVMKPGMISKPLRSPSGYHLIKLIAVRGGANIRVTEYHVQQILIKPSPTHSDKQIKAELDRLRHQLLMGASFSQLAKSYSEDMKTAAKGGHMGWLTPGMHSHTFDQQIKKTPVGQISQPFRTGTGWHLIKVLGHRKVNSTQKMVRTKAREILFLRKRQEVINDWIRKIREQAYIKIMLTAPSTTPTTTRHS